MFDLVAVLIALGLLMYLAYRGVTLLILAPAMALLAALLTGGLPILGAYTQIFISNTGSFIVSFFPLFMLACHRSRWRCCRLSWSSSLTSFSSRSSSR
jgi:H+/gluconate symporter-like permease